MTVRVNKSSFNIREKLSELGRKFGLKGSELVAAETVQEAREIVSAGRKNIIINGAMQVAQRGTTGTVSTAGNYPAVDRWSCNDGGIGGFTLSQSTDAPAGFANSAKWDCTSTGSATNDAFHEQKIESQDIQHLEYGTSSAKSFTISFWVKSNKTGEYSFWVENNDAARYFTTPGYTINAANTWEFKTITVPGDTGGSGFSNDNGIGFKLRWHLVLRTSFQGTPPGTWSTSASIRGQSGHVNFADSTSNEWYLTGVQLEVGKNATEFEHRPYGEELALCQRYYLNAQGSYALSVDIEDASFPSVQFPVEMRANPSTTVYSAASGTPNRMSRYGGTECTVSSVASSTRGINLIQHNSESAGRAWGFRYTSSAEL